MTIEAIRQKVEQRRLSAPSRRRLRPEERDCDELLAAYDALAARLVEAERLLRVMRNEIGGTPMPFLDYVDAFLSAASQPSVARCTKDGGECGLGGYCDEHPTADNSKVIHE